VNGLGGFNPVIRQPWPILWGYAIKCRSRRILVHGRSSSLRADSSRPAQSSVTSSKLISTPTSLRLAIPDYPFNFGQQPGI